MQEEFVSCNLSKEIILEEIGLSKYQFDKLIKRCMTLDLMSITLIKNSLMQ